MQELLYAHTIMQTVASNIDAAKWYLDNLQRTDRFFSRLDTSGRSVPPRTETGEIVLGNMMLIQSPEGVSPKYTFRVRLLQV